MNDSSSDGNENVIDIFVLSKSHADAPVRPEHLEQKGYRVTLFSDSTQLLETLRYGKPNLLVCDSLSLGGEAYEVCRQIKADNDLWMIPVLIVTGASNLADLLFVLDCNADNFIAHPFDPPYLLSLIDGILVTPVERQTPEQIKTQFKIQHDEHLFVVTADRRKLLEFLLSSFEIAVNKSDELARSKSENLSLMDAVKSADETAAEQNRIISVLNNTLQQREASITSLNGEIKEKSRQINDLAREKEFLVQEREENKSRIAAAEDENRRLLLEHGEMTRAFATESGELKQRITNLSDELTTANADLAATKRALEQETTRCNNAEAMLSELVPQKEQLEKNLRALTLEFGQLKTTCTAEQNRASAAEQEAKSLMQAKTQSEQDLTRIIDELKDTAKQQAGEITKLKDERAADKNRITSLESRLTGLAAEKETAECSLKNTAENLKRDLALLREKYGETSGALKEKERQYAALDQACQEKQALSQQLQKDLTSRENELEGARSALAFEKQQHAASVGSLQSALQERDSSLSVLKGAHAEVKTDLDSHRDELSLARQELARVVEDRNTLKSRLEESASLVRTLETKLQSASGEQAESDKQIRSISDEHEQLKSSLESERKQRRASEDSLKAARAESEKYEEMIRQAKGEQERLNAILSSERESSQKELERLNSLIGSEREELRIAGEHGREAGNACEQRIRELSSELDGAKERMKDLEEQVQNISREKDAALREAASFESELDQARVALADEWGDHMTDNERLAAAVEEKRQLEQTISRMPVAASQEKRVVVTRKTDLPVPVGPESRAVAAVPEVTRKDSPPRRISGVEDLFEDDGPAPEEPDEEPEVTIVRDTEPEVTIDRLSYTPVPGPLDEQSGAGGKDSGEDLASKAENAEGDVDEEEDEEAGEESAADEPAVPYSRPDGPLTAFSFDRSQWFDLLKWAHNSGALSQDQRLQIVKMGRLVQKGRRLTHKQDEQVREILALVQSLGYRFT